MTDCSLERMDSCLMCVFAELGVRLVAIFTMIEEVVGRAYPQPAVSTLNA